MTAPDDKKKTNPGKLALFSSVPARANPLLHPGADRVLTTPSLLGILISSNGAWRSLVARLNGVQEVAGSSPVAPTISPRRPLFAGSGPKRPA